ALGAPAGFALGAPGDLDPTFDGDGGRTLAAFATIDDLALQPDGRVVIAGLSSQFRFSVARLHRDGADDTSFGDGGAQTVEFGGGFARPKAVALQADGK